MLEGSWSVVRPDTLLECVVPCTCGATLLVVHAAIVRVKVVDVEGAKRSQLSDMDVEALADGLMDIRQAVGGNLKVDKRRNAILRELKGDRTREVGAGREVGEQ